MKIKLLFLAATFFSLNNSIAQNQTINNVSIGTEGPAYGTTIKANFPGASSGWARGYSIANESGNVSFIQFGSLGSVTNGVSTIVNSFIGKGFDNQYMTFLPSGNIGIGTTTPSAKLDINGDIKINGNLNIFNSANKIVGYDDPVNYYIGGFPVSGSAGLDIHYFGGIRFGDATSNSVMQITNGKVGIGTTNPDEKLTVKGKIHAEEIKVDLAVPADYVFQKYYTGKSELKSDYDMPTLAEIESFTKQNHHLPNVPSAQEIKQNGFSLGTMSNVLLQKIEELTLYAIEQQKELDRLKTENEKYKSLAERLSAIEKELKK
jgi:hypothetical protein